METEETRDVCRACSSCEHWTLARVTRYDDGSVIDNYRPPEGTGHCESLSLDTAPEFFCAKFSPCPSDFDHVYTSHKEGAPWQHWVHVPCPDCKGVGSSYDCACGRCAGTARVRKYDDGYVGEEQHRIHPKEKELNRKPRCGGCQKDMERNWVACPLCGWRYEPPASPEVVTDISPTVMS